MKKIELVKGISSSVLGFGCAPILGSVGAKTSLRALECALDCGINHFDLARSYGYGEAERFVGRVMRGRRDKVVLASKFGIVANWKAQLLSPAKPALRFVMRKMKGNTQGKPLQVANSGTTVADRFHDRPTLEPNFMRTSLEKSLRALNTDYLDYFFIHEALNRIENIDELCTVADKLKAEGKIRAWGITFMRSQEHLHESYLQNFDLLQFDCSPHSERYDETVARRGQVANAIFSPLSGGKTDIAVKDKLLRLFDDFPKSVILCSMFNERHLKENAALVNYS